MNAPKGAATKDVSGGGVGGAIREVSEVAAYRTGKNTLIRIIAMGEWSAIDIEALYEQIGHGLRSGAFDAALSEQQS